MRLTAQAPKPFLTVAEAATVMQVSRGTIYRLVNAGRLPAIRSGKSLRISRAALHAYLRESSTQTSANSPRPS
ncbi:helix-turn-helix domain-containing protein [Streptomyces sp. NPDC099088]|uniref:helix-turn-helix domain-containing protein n=1 Tax=Streptomyces sp. NPDC099088 TaxID=3366101 RepID=UPI00382A121A